MVIAVEHRGDVVFYHTDRALTTHSLKTYSTAYIYLQSPSICQRLLISQNMSNHQHILRADVKTQSLITSTIDSTQ